jgi:hypothetical protein
VRNHHGRAVSILAAALLLFSSCRSSAHEVPSELTVEAYLRPEQQTLQLLIRVPLSGLMGTGMPKVGVGYLDLANIEPSLRQTALQIAEALDIYEGDQRLTSPRVVATRISLPFDTAFASYDQALAQLMGPGLPVDTQVYWLQGFSDARIEYPIASDRSSFSLRTRLDNLAPKVTTSLRFLHPDGSVRTFDFLGDPGRFALDPRWYQAARVFLTGGFLHIIALFDQWLLGLCLLIAFARLRSLPLAIGAFAVGQVLASVALAYGPDATGEWLLPLVQTLIAAMLVGLTIQNIASERPMDRRLTMLIFGATSGIGFAIAMRTIAQFGGRHPIASIISFDIGLQAGQLVMLGLVAVPLVLLSRLLVAERMRRIILSALLLSVAWNVTQARFLAMKDLQWPMLTAPVLVTASSWLLVIVGAAGALWFAAGFFGSTDRSTEPSLAKAEGQRT